MTNLSPEVASEVVQRSYPDIIMVRRNYDQAWGGERRPAYKWIDGKVANIDIVQLRENGRYRQIHAYLSIEYPNQPLKDIGVSAFEFAGRDDFSRNWPVTYLIARPTGATDLKIGVVNRQSDIDPEEVLLTARQGLEIFDALRQLTVEEQLKYRKRAYDWLSEGFNQTAIARLMVEAGLSDDKPEFFYRYMLWGLKRESISVSNVSSNEIFNP